MHHRNQCYNEENIPLTPQNSSYLFMDQFSFITHSYFQKQNHINGFTQHRLICILLFSFSRVILRFGPVVTCLSSLFLFLDGSYGCTTFCFLYTSCNKLNFLLLLHSIWKQAERFPHVEYHHPRHSVYFSASSQFLNVVDAHTCFAQLPPADLPHPGTNRDS